MQARKGLSHCFVFGKIDGQWAQDCLDGMMVCNKVNLRLKPKVNLVHTNELKVGNNHRESYVEAFEVVMSSLDNKFCEENWYLDFGISHHVTKEKDVLDLMNHNFTTKHVKSASGDMFEIKGKDNVL
jgi:hypothetical protein